MVEAIQVSRGILQQRKKNESKERRKKGRKVGMAACTRNGRVEGKESDRDGVGEEGRKEEVKRTTASACWSASVVAKAKGSRRAQRPNSKSHLSVPARWTRAAWRGVRGSAAVVRSRVARRGAACRWSRTRGRAFPSAHHAEPERESKKEFVRARVVPSSISSCEEAPLRTLDASFPSRRNINRPWPGGRVDIPGSIAVPDANGS